MSAPPQGMSAEAIGQIRGMSDAALVAVYRNTMLRAGRAGYQGIIDALADELFARPHIDFDGEFIHNYNSDDGFGTLRRRKD